ncbi:nucleotidyltransferase family protein [Candidatus Uabimicrobium amorphum]|uniref:Nucleotidyltransferase family protein n=1 Tax=Uabimicrobium amorphum TaxID=2596890 RepID=A0A5S9IKV8_UABAM|nr:nucleotidyltransferase family protein [Candidatus Uabimicrobium amorphum]BBM83749.1 hypothetical protein UABAM_02103 [Candidatus Uabimicrobium amorphum]
MTTLEKKLVTILQNNPKICHILQVLESINPPNWYLGAGCITQSIWNNICNCEIDYGVKDYDIVYFDCDISQHKERQYTQKIQSALPEITIDVTNQARVHLWYHNIFNKTIQPYTSVEDAIKSWPTTASAIGVHKEKQQFSVCAPFGLHDLFSLIVRPNKLLITEDVYIAKVQRWLEKWPQLNIIEW